MRWREKHQRFPNRTLSCLHMRMQSKWMVILEEPVSNLEQTKLIDFDGKNTYIHRHTYIPHITYIPSIHPHIHTHMVALFSGASHLALCAAIGLNAGHEAVLVANTVSKKSCWHHTSSHTASCEKRKQTGTTRAHARTHAHRRTQTHTDARTHASTWILYIYICIEIDIYIIYTQ